MRVRVTAWHRRAARCPADRRAGRRRRGRRRRQEGRDTTCGEMVAGLLAFTATSNGRGLSACAGGASSELAAPPPPLGSGDRSSAVSAFSSTTVEEHVRRPFWSALGKALADAIELFRALEPNASRTAPTASVGRRAAESARTASERRRHRRGRRPPRASSILVTLRSGSRRGPARRCPSRSKRSMRWSTWTTWGAGRAGRSAHRGGCVAGAAPGGSRTGGTTTLRRAPPPVSARTTWPPPVRHHERAGADAGVGPACRAAPSTATAGGRMLDPTPSSRTRVGPLEHVDVGCPGCAGRAPR